MYLYILSVACDHPSHLSLLLVSTPGKQRPVSMALGEDLATTSTTTSAKHPWPEVEAIQRDREKSNKETSRATKSTKSSFSSSSSSQQQRDDGLAPALNPAQKKPSTKRKGGLFSKFRKSTTDVSAAGCGLNLNTVMTYLSVVNRP